MANRVSLPKVSLFKTSLIVPAGFPSTKANMCSEVFSCLLFKLGHVLC